MKINFYAISFVAHLLLFGFALITMTISDPASRIGSMAIPVIHSWVERQEVAKEKVAQKPDKTELALKKNLLKKIINKKPQSKQQIRQLAHGQQVEKLLTYLHAAIQKEQEYPESAREMEREGRTSVKFTLMLSGEVANLRISKSSGTKSLDDAALLAVRRAAPFHEIRNYLDKSKEFSIDVVFDLA